MLDRKVVEDFLLEKMKDDGIDILERIDKRKLVEAFVDTRKTTTTNG